METLRHERVYLANRTLGSYYWQGQMIAKVLELPWLDNKRAISCILEGRFRVTKEPPIPKFDPQGRKFRPYWHFRIHNVPNRSGILIHRGADIMHSKGCQLPGSRFSNFYSSQPTIAESSVKLQWMVDNLPDEFMIEIITKPEVL
jgi:hypothetical protein